MAGKENKGKPGDTGKDRSSVKDQKSTTVAKREREEVYQEKYTDDEGENPAGNVRQMNPNRNREKGRRE